METRGAVMDDEWTNSSLRSGGLVIPRPPSLTGRDRRLLCCSPKEGLPVRAGISFWFNMFSSGCRKSQVRGLVRQRKD